MCLRLDRLLLVRSFTTKLLTTTLYAIVYNWPQICILELRYCVLQDVLVSQMFLFSQRRTIIAVS